jgi:hypothetical protein
MSKPNVPRTCEQCGDGFFAYPSAIKKGYGRFCSNHCARLEQWANNATTTQRECMHCGQTFTARTKFVKCGGAKYCSQPCAKAAQIVPAEDRFWTKVRKTDTCWPWQGSTRGRGYGILGMKRGEKWGSVQAHIFSYALHNGPIPDGLCVLHHCDNPPCVRPSHLFLGTRATNNLDMAMKERATSPLTTAQVRQIRIRYERGGVTQKQLGVEFGVHTGTIKGIIQRRRWAHVG